MEYKKYNIYDGVKISERILSVLIVLGLVVLAVIIISFAKAGGEEDKIESEIRLLAENDASPAPINKKNTENYIK